MNMNRRTFVKTLLATAISATIPASFADMGPVVQSQSTVYVYSQMDFPAPADGVITLKPNTNYVMMNRVDTIFTIRHARQSSIIRSK